MMIDISHIWKNKREKNPNICHLSWLQLKLIQ